MDDNFYKDIIINMRNKIITIALAEIGYKESPPDSNITKYGEWYGLNGRAWCAIFVSWVFNNADCKLPKINCDKGFSKCQSMYEYAKKNNLLTVKPQTGDIILFDWENNGHYDHTGIFMKDNEDDKYFTSIEGNTAVDNNSNGGIVMKRTKRPYSLAKFVNIESFI
jgi:hypothetical protein